MLRTGEVRSLAFLRQRLGIAVQRGNAAAVIGTIPWEDTKTAASSDYLV